MNGLPIPIENLSPDNIEMLINTLITMYWGIILITGPVAFCCKILALVAQAKVYIKAKYPGWAVLIPYYTQYISSCIGYCTDAFWVLVGATSVSVLCSPFLVFDFGTVSRIFLILRIVANLVVLVCKIRIVQGVSKAFKQGFGFTLGLFLLPFIFYPILAWGKSRHHRIDNDATSPYNGREHGYAEMMKESQNQ